jgi:hypothetical protein
MDRITVTCAVAAADQFAAARATVDPVCVTRAVTAMHEGPRAVTAATAVGRTSSRGWGSGRTG